MNSTTSSLELLALAILKKNEDNNSDISSPPSSPLSENDENKFMCVFCSRQFYSKRNLIDHEKSHQPKKPHVCPYEGCGKSFLRPAHLEIHIRIHTGEKPFVCEFEGCGKRWNQKSALKQHMRCHTGEKPFQCPIEGCNKRFSTSSSCKRHYLIHQPILEENLNKKRKIEKNVLNEKDYSSISSLFLVPNVFHDTSMKNNNLTPHLQVCKMTLSFILN